MLVVDTILRSNREIQLHMCSCLSREKKSSVILKQWVSRVYMYDLFCLQNPLALLKRTEDVGGWGVVRGCVSSHCQ